MIGDTSIGPTALAITSPITIQGNAAGITIQREAGAAEMRLFRVTAAGNLTLESIMLTGGVARGANGTAGAPNGVDGRGGAIFVDQQCMLNITASTLYDNRAIGGNAAGGGNGGSGLGGAIYNDGGTVTIANATLSGNFAVAGVGTANGSRFGGAIYSRNGTLSISNSTIANNSAVAGRGVYVLADGATAAAMIQSTIIGQSDSNPIVTELVAATDHDGTVITSGGNNLIRVAVNFEGTIVSTADPKERGKNNFGVWLV